MIRRRVHPLNSVLAFLLVMPVGAAEEFPGAGLLPKHETGAVRFLEQHPEFDGRGVVVAIFDTGVDPSAAGLQTTTDGKPKIIDMIDGSGSGDVDTSAVREVAAGSIEGLTGRRLEIPESWTETNPSGQYHVGIKRAFELFPTRLVRRLKQERRKKWDAGQRILVARVQRQILAFDEDYPDPEGDQKKARQDLQTRLDVLQATQKDFDDPGPIYDCVVFKDGDVWHAVIDTDEDGQLADETLLSNFRLNRKYATIGSEALLSFAVNIYDDGDLLSIVTDCGSHGTHVAGIVAAHFPSQPELNGLAPGAQIVSVKIGDRRLGSSSVGTGEIRGLIAVLQNRCDLINMSYGGPTTDPNRGKLIEYYSDIVNKHQVIFVASAGNDGPALSTVGSPGGTTSAIIGVGAYVSPAMMRAEYALRKQLPEIPYTWSARGPTSDGDIGVNICAPGGAIATMPKWSLRPNALMNGTSMSSPNACGNIALILSGLKSERIAYTPHSVLRAVENTARALHNSDVFAHGHGLIQTDNAFDYLKQHAQADGELLRLEVDLPQRDNSRGVYLRDPYESMQRMKTQVRVRPFWHEDADNQQKVDFQLRVRVESTADWIESPEFLLVTHGGRTFNIEVDPTQLDEGVHFAEVVGYDATDDARGSIFRLPVTVVSPQRCDAVWRKQLRLRPGVLDRNFIAVPESATWADLTIRAEEAETAQVVVVHAMQQLPKIDYSDSEFQAFISVDPNSETVRSFKVTGGQTLELCLGQNWSSLGDGHYGFELEFHGVVPSDPDLQFDGSLVSGRVDISAPLRSETVHPAASLKMLRRSIRPQRAKLRPLSAERDSLPEGRQFYEMILQYQFELDDEAEVTPWSALGEHDESWFAFSSSLWQIFDAEKQLMGSGEWDNPVTLRKGKYVLRFHLRHEQAAALRKFENMALLLDRTLKKPISLGVYTDPDDLTAGHSQFEARTLQFGDRTTLYFSLPTNLPEFAQHGDILIGNVTFGKVDASLSGAGKRPDGFSIRVVVPPATPNHKSKSKTEDDSDSKSLADKLRDTQFNHLVHLRKQQDREQFDQLSETLLKESDEKLKLRLLAERIKFLDDNNRKPKLPEIVRACDQVISEIDQQQLATHYGVKLNPDDKHAMDRRNDMDRLKETLVDALYRKARALAFMDLPAKYSDPDDPPAKQFPEQPEERHKLFEETFSELQNWVDVTDPKTILVHLRRERRHNRQGLALKALNAHIRRSPPTKLLFKKRGDIYDELGWDQWRDYERKWLLLRSPQAYPPF